MVKIKFFKTILAILVCAGFALTYVHQEVEIVKQSLTLNKNRRNVTLLLDQYRSLVYNLSRLESPKRIEERLSRDEIILCMPKIDNIRRVERINLVYSEGQEGADRKETFLARVFDRFSTKAEAKVINTSLKPKL